MFGVVLALALQLVTPGPGATIDWSSLPLLPYRERPDLPPSVHDYVARQVALRQCPTLRTTDGRHAVQADVAVLVGEDGMIRVTIPRAIDCPTVEQFAAGFVESSARNNLRRGSLQSGGGWYRATLVFTWAS